MSRLIIISNRVQVTISGAAGAQGGLSVALGAALQESGGIWFGWSGEVTDQFTGHIHFQRSEMGVTTATIDLEEQDVEEYYNGYANRTLWPLFHYRIDLAEYERGFAGGYQRVNERFADTVRPLIEPDDMLWVHDYHLILLGAELRALGIDNLIGFFLHTPWPPRALFSVLPEAHELATALFAYDLVGFQTDEWLQSFLEYAVHEMGAILGPDGSLTYGSRTVRCIACPIGIDAQEFATLARSPSAMQAFQQMRSSVSERAIIVGVDRLDYSKGLEERFLGYERFLDMNPEECREVLLLQIAPPSRETVESYRKIRATLEGISGRINGSHADLDWTPIRYVNQGYPRDVLAGVYRAARIGLVTPLRDGMNLVAKEYVAAQDPEDPGVLILSRFAGAAEQLREAVLVNPYSAEEISDAIQQALHMSHEERFARWRALMDNIEQEGVDRWLATFTEALASIGPPDRHNQDPNIQGAVQPDPD